MAWHIDRLTRKLTDLEELIVLAESRALKVVTVTGDVDLSNDSGRLVSRILASVARGEVERKGARQKRAQQQAAQQGRPAGGRRAFGYESDGLTVRQEEAQHIPPAFEHVLSGGSLKSLARDWNDEGLTTTAGGAWRHDNVRGVLRNPRYAGLRSYKGEIVGPATWPALVDEETFYAAHALLSLPERRTTASTARKHLLPGIALCWKCGSDVATGHTRHGKRVYVCRASKCLSRAAEPVDELIEEVVIARLSRPDALDLLADPGPDLGAKRAEIAATRERLDDLATALADGILPMPAVRRSSDKLHGRIAALEAEIQAMTGADVLGPLVTAHDPRAVWEVADLAQRRAIIETLMRITLLKPAGGRTAFDPATVQIEWRRG